MNPKIFATSRSSLASGRIVRSDVVAHGLRIIAELLQTNTQLIANKAAWNDPWKRAKIENMNTLLQGALRAEKLVALKMNAPTGIVDKIMELLPSMNSPIIAHLHN